MDGTDLPEPRFFFFLRAPFCWGVIFFFFVFGSIFLSGPAEAAALRRVSALSPLASRDNYRLSIETAKTSFLQISKTNR